MKKQLISILALILCFCTVFVFASCGKQDTNDESSSDESLNESNNTTDKNGDDEFDVEEGLEDVDSVTAEDIFAQMKAAYKATVDYKDAYAINIKWTEDQTDTEVGKGGGSNNNKLEKEEKLTADPSTGKFVSIYTHKSYENGNKVTDEIETNKIFSENSKNYRYLSSKIDGEELYDNNYNLLSAYEFSNKKSGMLLNTKFGANSHFAESFGDPFSASSASDLKTIHTSVINEVKENQKSIYEADGWIVEQITAKANVIFNKENDINILKRTITLSCNRKNEAGTEKMIDNLTVESLLKSKDGKLLSFVSTSTENSENTYGSSTAQTETTSSLSYNFSYALDNTTYNSIKTSIPASVNTAPDSFEVPISFYINGNEVTVNIIGEASDSNSVANILENAIDGYFSVEGVEYDGKWYTDMACTKELDISTITSIEKLQNIKKLYNVSFKVNGNYAFFIDSGKETVNIPKNYVTVFGAYASQGILDTLTYPVEMGGEDNPTVSFEPKPGITVTLKLNDTVLKYDANPELSDFIEQPTGEFTAELIVDGGKIYFINRSNVVTKSVYVFKSFFVVF